MSRPGPDSTVAELLRVLFNESGSMVCQGGLCKPQGINVDDAQGMPWLFVLAIGPKSEELQAWVQGQEDEREIKVYDTEPQRYVSRDPKKGPAIEHIQYCLYAVNQLLTACTACVKNGDPPDIDELVTWGNQKLASIHGNRKAVPISWGDLRLYLEAAANEAIARLNP